MRIGMSIAASTSTIAMIARVVPLVPSATKM
jgi:hypothetical protein